MIAVVKRRPNISDLQKTQVHEIFEEIKVETFTIGARNRLLHWLAEGHPGLEGLCRDQLKTRYDVYMTSYAVRKQVGRILFNTTMALINDKTAESFLNENILLILSDTLNRISKSTLSQSLPDDFFAYLVRIQDACAIYATTGILKFVSTHDDYLDTQSLAEFLRSLVLPHLAGMWKEFADGLDASRHSHHSSATLFLAAVEANLVTGLRKEYSDSESILSVAFRRTACIQHYIVAKPVADLYTDKTIASPTFDTTFKIPPLWKQHVLNTDKGRWNGRVQDVTALLKVILQNFMESFLKAYRQAISIGGFKVLCPEAFDRTTGCATDDDEDDGEDVGRLDAAVRAGLADIQFGDEDNDDGEGIAETASSATHEKPKRSLGKTSDYDPTLVRPIHYFIVGASTLAMVNSLSVAEFDHRVALFAGLDCSEGEANEHGLPTCLVKARETIPGRLIRPKGRLFGIIEKLEVSLTPLLLNVRLLALLGGRLFWSFLRAQINTSKARSDMYDLLWSVLDPLDLDASTTDIDARIDLCNRLTRKFFAYYCGVTMNDYVLHIMDSRQYAESKDKVSMRLQVLLGLIKDDNGIEKCINSTTAAIAADETTRD
jgi:hypothetical protein